MHRKTVTGKVCLTPYEKLLKSGVKLYNGEVKDIELPLLHPFKNHPFKVVEDEHMKELVESIKEKGVLSPAIVRRMETGGYEIISGHRRKRACELAGLLTMPVIIKDLDDDEATILMVDANIQRENILPSERAFSLQMKMEALKRQGSRSDLEKTSSEIGQETTSDHNDPKLQKVNSTSGHNVPKSQEDELTSRRDVEKLDRDKEKATSAHSEPKLEVDSENELTSGHYVPKLAAEIIGEGEGLCGRQIKRYIRLTNLIPDLLIRVDNGKIGLVQGVDLSFIDAEKQQIISTILQGTDKSMTVKQAKMLREAAEAGTLDEDTAFNIILGKTAFLRTVTFSEKELKRYFPEEVNSAQIKRFMIGLLNDWKEKP